MPITDLEERRKYQREWIARRRREWLGENGPCAKCGSNEALNLHHVDPTQKEHHGVWSWAKERREKELSKCIVLCKYCHIQVHSDEATRVRKHGTYGMYKRGCKCRSCKDKNNERAARGRLRRGI